MQSNTRACFVSRLQLAIGAVPGAAGQRAGLVERAGVEQSLDPLPHREPSARVLALDALAAAKLAGQCLAPVQLLELRLPRHRRAAYGRASARLRRGAA